MDVLSALARIESLKVVDPGKMLGGFSYPSSGLFHPQNRGYHNACLVESFVIWVEQVEETMDVD